MSADTERMNAWDYWLSTRPESVQRLAAEFPIGTVVSLDGADHYVLGYTEGDSLILSAINPADDYDAANNSKIYLCASHLRTARTEGEGR